MSTRLALLTAALLLAVPTTAHAQMPRTGFVAEMRLGGGYQLTTPASGPFIGLPSLFLGARLLGRIHVGVGFEFFRISQPTSATTTKDTSEFVFAPGVAVDIIKATDERVALYGKAALLLGDVVAAATAFPNDNSFITGYDLGLGVRYSPHPMFAFGVETGVFGMFFSPGQSDSVGITSVYGALVGTFFYGR